MTLRHDVQRDIQDPLHGGKVTAVPVPSADGLHDRWYRSGSDPLDANGTFACQRLRNAYFPPVVKAGFNVRRDDRLFAIGSCFARGIEKALKARSFAVESAAADFDQFSVVEGRSVTALGFTNKYTTYSILNELRWALDPAAIFPEASLVDLDEKHCIDPHINPTLVTVDRAGTLARRRILQEVNARIRDCRVVFITLGLVEVWYDTLAGVHLNTSPVKEAKQLFPMRYQFQATRYPENLENMEQVYALLTKYGHPDLRIVVTTSPVPLQATFTGADIVSANTYSKSTLRAVAQDFAADHPNVHYFPSYEIVMNSDRAVAWEKDLRHVTGRMTNYVMDVFMRNFVTD
jgi:GSCFA family